MIAHYHMLWYEKNWKSSLLRSWIFYTCITNWNNVLSSKSMFFVFSSVAPHFTSEWSLNHKLFFFFLLYFSIFNFSPFIDKCISTIQYNIPCKYLSVHTLFERYRLHNLRDRIIAKGKRKKLILVKVKDNRSRSPSTVYICRLDTDSTVLGRRTPLWLGMQVTKKRTYSFYFDLVCSTLAGHLSKKHGQVQNIHPLKFIQSLS